jgi:DNA-binding transcriptional LysR family regulator
MLEMRRLRVLHAVARHGSIAAAAVALGYSGPAVSQQLAALEREVGVPLTERSGRTVALTAAASVLVAHTDVLFAQLAAAESDLAGFKDQVAGVVKIGAFPSAAACLLPDAWAAVTATAPHVQIDLEEMEPEESLGAVLQHRVDIALAHSYDLLPRPLDGQYEVRPMLEDPVLVAVRADAGDALPDPVDLATLADRDFLTPRSGTSCAEMVSRACARSGFVPHVVARATDFEVLLRLVGAGVGVALVPRLAATQVPANVRLLRPQPSVTRNVYAASLRGGLRKPAVRLVLDEIAAAADRHEGADGSRSQDLLPPGASSLTLRLG